MKVIAIVAIIVLAFAVGVAVGRYGSMHPCDMLAMEAARLRPNIAPPERTIFAHRSPGRCLVALWRVFTQDPVEAIAECMRTELGDDLSKVPKPRLAAVHSKCSSLSWFLWRQEGTR
jgi:hypothetical protein